jgi:DNA invertase Pin-like site-specific DNA recombinase
MFDKKRFKAQVVLSGKTYQEIAKELGVDQSTLYRKINADGNFTRSEINALIDILDIENPQDIFFAQELA